MRNLILLIMIAIAGLRAFALERICTLRDSKGAEAGYINIEHKNSVITHTKRPRKCGTDVNDVLDGAYVNVNFYKEHTGSSLTLRSASEKFVVDRGCSEGNASVYNDFTPAKGILSDFTQYGGLVVSANLTWKGDVLQSFEPKTVTVVQLSENLNYNVSNCRVY